MNNDRILVTGGAGFVGSNLCEALLSLSPELIVIADNFFLGHANNLLNVQLAENVLIERVDVSDSSTLLDIIDKYQIKTIWNLAVVPLPTSLHYPLWTLRNNIAIACAVAEAVRLREDVRIINVSSSEVYGSAKTIPMSEEHVLHPRTPYAASKLSADAIFESYAETFKLNIKTVRPFNMFGPRQNMHSYAGVIPLFVSKILINEPLIIHGSGEQTRDFTFVEEAIKAMISLSDPKISFKGPVNIGTSVQTSVLQIATYITEYLNVVGYPTIFGERRMGDVEHHQADVSKLVELGISPPIPINIEQIGKTVDFYVTQVQAAHQ